MDLINIDEFLDDIMPQLPGCTEFLAQDKLRLAAIEFCRRSLVSQETIDELDLEMDDPEVTVPAPNNSVKVYKIMWARIPHRTLSDYRRQGLANRHVNWDEIGSGEWPTGFIQTKKGSIQVIPTPDRDQDESLTVHAAFIPSRAATRFDAILLDEYREAIASGALSKLLNMRNEVWYDPNDAKVHAMTFAAEISNARATVNKDRLMADTRVQLNRF